MRETLLAALAEGLAKMQLMVPAHQQQQLVDYVTLLARWNKVHNLTAVKAPVDMISRHVLDSLSISSFIQGPTLLDVGAGAGLPGIPLAITHPELSVTLVDSVHKKTQFMAISAASIGLENVHVVHGRVEAMDESKRFSMVTARAFSRVETLCTLTQGLIEPGGQVLAMIGRQLNHEQLESLQRLNGYTAPQFHKLCVPGEQGERNLVTLQCCEA